MKQALEKIAEGHKLLQEGYLELVKCCINDNCTSSNVEVSKTGEEITHQDMDKSLDQQKRTVTIEDVRAVLAVKTRDGKTQAVKTLLNDFGAEKLSSVPVEKLPELLVRAESL